MKINQALQLATSWMDSIEGVIGVGQSLTEDGQDAIMVYVTNPNVGDKLPTDVEDVPVLITVSGEIDAQ